MRASGAASGVSASALRFAPVAAPWGALPATGAGPPANDFQSVTGFVICGFHRASRLFPGSSAVEQPAVNRLVAGSNPARGANSRSCSDQRARRFFDATDCTVLIYRTKLSATGRRTVVFVGRRSVIWAGRRSVGCTGRWSVIWTGRWSVGWAGRRSVIWAGRRSVISVLDREDRPVVKASSGTGFVSKSSRRQWRHKRRGCRL